MEKELRLDWAKDGGKMPSALKKKPKLQQGDRYYYDAFHELSTSRGQGESFGSIPETQYEAWFNNTDVYGAEARDRHKRALRPLDSVFVKYVHEKRKQEMEKLQKKGASGGGGLPRR